jgi:plastocyanin
MKKSIRCTSAWLAFFVCVPLLIENTSAQDSEAWGNLAGQIILAGPLPQIAEEQLGSNPDKEHALIDGKVPLDNNLTVGSNGEFKDVLVMMYLAPGEDDPTYHASYDEKKAQPVTLDNVKCRFVPHTLFVRPGQKLVLKNSDPVGHNCHIIAFNNEHNINLPANGTAEVLLDKSEKAPGEVKCDIHPWMDSVIMIRDNPYVAFTDAEGRFTIENIPAGKWKFQFWHKKVGWFSKMNAEGYEVGKRGEIEIEIKPGETLDLGILKLPANALKN